MSSSLMWLLAGLSSVLAVGWRCQFLATRDSPWGKLQHGSWLLSERVIRERKETENAPKTKMCLLILLLPVPLTPHPSGLQPPAIPPIGSSAGLLALSSALGGQSHLPIKDEKKHHDSDHQRGE